MSILFAAAIGAAAGLIVSSWQGFKDPPWEGFFVGRFLRSIVVGATAGAAFAVASARGLVAVDNLGVMAFAIVAVERVVGEAYKGFFRRGAHAEYFKLLRRLGIPEAVTAISNWAVGLKTKARTIVPNAHARHTMAASSRASGVAARMLAPRCGHKGGQEVAFV